MAAAPPAPGAPSGAPSVGTALVGFAAGIFVSAAFVGIADGLHHGHASSFTEEVVSFIGLWVGLLGAVIAGRPAESRLGGGLLASLRTAYGLSFRPIDLPLGIVCGLGGQYGLVPLVDLVLLPFVPHLNARLDAPAKALVAPGRGAGAVVLGLCICVGAPVVEELFFRGLLLRGLLGRLGRLGGRIGPALSIACCGLLFGLAHFEALEFLALSCFGMLLGVLAERTGRLGPSMVAHAFFNGATFFTLVHVF